MSDTSDEHARAGDPVIVSMAALEASENPYQHEGANVPMNTTWRVRKVIAIEGRTTAELVRVEWFKPNPAYLQMMAEYDALIESVGKEEAQRITAEQDDGEWLDETLEAEPGEETAEYFEPGGEALTVDITDGLDLKPGDNVRMTLDAVERVPA